MNRDIPDEPELTPKLLSDEKEVLIRAAEKWLSFHKCVWENINIKLENDIRRFGLISISLRLLIIILSASVTTISSMDEVQRKVVTISSGVLTALTGVEAFLKYGERQMETKRQQREIEALRDQIRYKWFVEVEIEPDMDKRILAAKKLLQEGPSSYNEILNKYALKAEKGEEPAANV